MTDEYISKHDAVNIAESYEVKIDGFCLDDYEYGRDQVANSIANDLEDIPAVDVAPVVRCRDCKHWDNGNLSFECPWDYGRHGSSDEDDFCSYGERKE